MSAADTEHYMKVTLFKKTTCQNSKNSKVEASKWAHKLMCVSMSIIYIQSVLTDYWKPAILAEILGNTT